MRTCDQIVDVDKDTGEQRECGAPATHTFGDNSPVCDSCLEALRSADVNGDILGVVIAIVTTEELRVRTTDALLEATTALRAHSYTPHEVERLAVAVEYAIDALKVLDCRLLRLEEP